MPSFTAGRTITPDERRLRAAIASAVAAGRTENLAELRTQYRALTVSRRVADLLLDAELTEDQRFALIRLLVRDEVAP